MSKAYEVLGHPAFTPTPELHLHGVGETVELDLSKEREQELVDMGALRPVKAAAKTAKKDK